MEFERVAQTKIAGGVGRRKQNVNYFNGDTETIIHNNLSVIFQSASPRVINIKK